MMLNRVSLNTIGLNRIGLNRIGKPSRGSSDRPYIDPEVLASLKAVCICYGKSNDDPDRAIIKNLVDPDNPFVISNAAFKLNSGFGEYKEDFTTWSKVAGTSIITDSKYVLTDEKAITNAGYFLWNRLAKDSFKVKISNIPNGGWMSYRYRITKEDTQFSSLFIREDGIYTLPATVAGSDVDFFISTASAPAKDWVGLTITQIPSFEGAFFTDGIDDLITSTKSATEMLDGSNEITVVSMIHQIKTNSDVTRNNWFFTPVSYLENRVVENKTGKTGIYGYTSTNVTNAQISDITPILGDKNDYTLYSKIEDGDRDYFTVEGFQNQGIWYVSSIAWYWTIIANKVLTTDQINQVIAYFNLDRTLKPDILCDVKKQGITNDNHAEFGDKLIDFSGNGRDIQLNNLAWDGDSGIGKYNYPNWKVTATIANTYSTIVNYPTVNGTYSINVNGVSELMQSIGLHLEIKYTTSTGIIYNDIKQDGVYSYILPDGATDLTLRFGGIPGIVNEPCNITITQIPSHAGALCLDGVNDFGKVTGMPIYKDYTVVADRKIVDGLVASADGGVALKGSKYLIGAFVFDYKDSCWSFGTHKMIPLDTKRFTSYQSKYVSNGISIDVGTATDNDELWIGRLGIEERYSKLALWSLLLFPYSMSEFLIERQLKKRKLGTLYQDMVEFRPVIKSSVELATKPTFVIRGTSTLLNAGDYIPENSELWVVITMNNVADRITKFVINGNTIDIPSSAYNPSTMKYGFPFTIDSKSPQKIGITIEQDENYVQWNPVVESNVPYKSIVYRRIDVNPWATINVGDYLPIGTRMQIVLGLHDSLDEISSVDSNQLDNITINGNEIICSITSKSPQKINITIYQPPEYLTMLSNSTLISNETLIKNE